MCSRKSRSRGPRAVSASRRSRPPPRPPPSWGKGSRTGPIELARGGRSTPRQGGRGRSGRRQCHVSIGDASTNWPSPASPSRSPGPEGGGFSAGRSTREQPSKCPPPRSPGDSAYAGIVKLVTAAQTAKRAVHSARRPLRPLFPPFTCAIAFIAWLISGDVIRSLAVFVAATPCPLILAAPVAFIAGVARSARRGILVKGGGPLEALARGTRFCLTRREH